MAFRPEEATPNKAEHVKSYPESYFLRLHEALELGGPRCEALDLGTGLGEIARGLARYGAQVVGIDSDSALLEQARADESPENAQVRYEDASAEDSGREDQSIDLVIAGQSWQAFDANAAAVEAHRVLRPRAHLVIVHYAWQSLPRNIVEATENIVGEIAPAWPAGGTNGLFGVWHPSVRAAGFGEHQTFLHDVGVAFNHAQWRDYAARRLAERLSAEECKKISGVLGEELPKRFPGDYLVAPHRVLSYIAQKQ